ncbi:MAG: hypothetical protein HQ592_12105 [Planctomycetes bacterium]|nr:hypothetical protein [Planctomycetota bacterium]
MNATIQERLRRFTATLLTRSGGLVEWPAGSEEGLAVLPLQVAAALHCPETVSLSYRPDADGLCANLATDFLDRIVPLVEAEPRIGLFQIPELYLKQSDMSGPVALAFTWLNAKVVVRHAKPAQVEYHAWYFLASIVSEDRWEDVIPVTVNAASGAAVALVNPLSSLDLEMADQPQSPPPSSYQAAVMQAHRLMQRRAAPFVGRLESRLERDRKRLRDYYNALLREDTNRKRRNTAQDDEDKQRAKRRAVKLELGRKLAELDERYAISAELRPAALIRLSFQTLAVHCDVFRKQARKPLVIYWNPLLKELEPLSCSACGASTFSVAFTNKDVAPLCPVCAGRRS